MKAKTIKAVLRKKLDAWLETLPESIRDQVRKNTIVTGGCIASMLLKEKVNDIDIYFRDFATTVAVAKHYVERFKAEREPNRAGGVDVPLYVRVDNGTERNDSPDLSIPGRVRIVAKSAGIAQADATETPYQYFESRAPEEAGDYVSEVMDDPGAIVEKLEDVKDAINPDDGKPPYRPVFLSTNAITLSNAVQLIIRFYGEPDEIHENYDFVHCTNYYDGGSGELVLRPAALEALLSRELRYIGSKYPLCSLIRVRKFVARHWTINAGQILKMCLQLNELDLKDVTVLEDQLTGVDVAYFAEIISKVKAQDPEKINSAYLVEIIDRMF